MPRSKDELVRFFVVKMGYHASGLRKMAKTQLYAIYHRVMREKHSYSNFELSS